MSKKFIIYLIFTSFVNNIFGQGLISNEEAEKLVKSTLKLPVHIYFKTEIQGGGALLDWFQADGLLNYSGRSSGGYYINTIESITAKGRACKMKVVDNGKMLEFKTMDLAFGKVIGIASNKEEQTATIRFSVIPQNSTSPAKMFKKSLIRYELEEQKIGQLVYRKFDSGWQLDSDFDKSHRQIIEKIIGPLEQSYFIEGVETETNSATRAENSNRNFPNTRTEQSITNELNTNYTDKYTKWLSGKFQCKWGDRISESFYSPDGKVMLVNGKKTINGTWQIVKNTSNDYYLHLEIDRTLFSQMDFKIIEISEKHFIVEQATNGNSNCKKTDSF